MPNQNSSLEKALGLALIVIGAGLAYWGYQMSESLSSQVSSTITGSLPKDVMYRYIGGAASAIAGVFLFLKK